MVVGVCTGPMGPWGSQGGHWGLGLMVPWESQGGALGAGPHGPLGSQGGHWGPGLMAPWGSQGDTGGRASWALGDPRGALANAYHSSEKPRSGPKKGILPT